MVASQTPKDFQRKSKTAQLGNIKTVGSRMENDDWLGETTLRWRVETTSRFAYEGTSQL